MSNYCRRCGKPLTSDKSRALGIGPECLKQSQNERYRRPLFDMGKASRNKKARKKNIKHFKKEERGVIDAAITASANYYTAAMLITLKDELGFGPKRAQRFAAKVQEQFDCINAGTVSFNDIKQAVLDELGIEIR